MAVATNYNDCMIVFRTTDCYSGNTEAMNESKNWNFLQKNDEEGITQVQYEDETSGYGHFYDIEDITEPRPIYTQFIADEEIDTDNSICITPPRKPLYYGNKLVNTLISVSVITVVIIYIFIIL
jgi:hypothetical protein